MKPVQFSIDINAGRERIWDVLWQDASLRQWTGIIDPGTYMVGELAQGNEVQFLSEGGYGVTSLVEKIIPNELLLLRHSNDTQDFGSQDRQKQWAGGAEIYTLTDKNGVTELTVAFDVPLELEAEFNKSYPKALACIKSLSEL